jgi:hypothetical protein
MDTFLADSQSISVKAFQFLAGYLKKIEVKKHLLASVCLIFDNYESLETVKKQAK